MASPNKRSIWEQIGDYASLGILLPACTVTGYFLGLLLDHWLGTNYLKIVFLILGIVAGFIQLIRMVSRDSS